jgi:hypothetical protein
MGQMNTPSLAFKMGLASFNFLNGNIAQVLSCSKAPLSSEVVQALTTIKIRRGAKSSNALLLTGLGTDFRFIY